MRPLVSVVITTYNGLDTIERAVKSVVNQTYKNIEIIVVDDNGIGSNTQIKTEEIIRNLNNDIVYIPHEKNLNGSAARNTGIKNANGKYVALLDDDDAFRYDKLEKQVSSLESKGDEYGLCYTGTMIHFANGKTKEILPEDEGDLFEKVMLRQIKAATSVLLFRKDIAVQLNYFDDTFKRHQDWEFLDRVSSKFLISVVSDVCVDRYIYQRTSAKNPEQYEENRLFYLNKMKVYIEKLPKKTQKEIYQFHYKSILREYLKTGNLSKSLLYFYKSGNPIKTFRSLIIDYFYR